MVTSAKEQHLPEDAQKASLYGRHNKAERQTAQTSTVYKDSLACTRLISNPPWQTDFYCFASVEPAQSDWVQSSGHTWGYMDHHISFCTLDGKGSS